MAYLQGAGKIFRRKSASLQSFFTNVVVPDLPQIFVQEKDNAPAHNEKR
jgi:hypothetical protein